jgi:tetratricopeptide (TPR) repeat protein
MSKARLSMLWFLIMLPFQAAHADAFMDDRWFAVNSEVQALKQKGDYKLAFLVLDHYIKQTAERLYPNDFSLASALSRRAYFRQVPGNGQMQLFFLWKTISMDAEAFGRNNPIVGYDYAAIGAAYVALNDFQQADSYYLQSVKILSAAFRSYPVSGMFDPKPSAVSSARERYAGAFNPSADNVSAWIPQR